MTYKEGEITFTGLNDDTKIRCTAEGEIYLQDELQNYRRNAMDNEIK